MAMDWFCHEAGGNVMFDANGLHQESGSVNCTILPSGVVVGTDLKRVTRSAISSISLTFRA